MTVKLNQPEVITEVEADDYISVLPGEARVDADAPANLPQGILVSDLATQLGVGGNTLQNIQDEIDANSEAIANETQARVAAGTTLQANVNVTIQAEETARIAGDATLQTAIDAIPALPALATTDEMETGTETDPRLVSPSLVQQAIVALGGGDGNMTFSNWVSGTDYPAGSVVRTGGGAFLLATALPENERTLSPRQSSIWWPLTNHTEVWLSTVSYPVGTIVSSNAHPGVYYMRIISSPSIVGQSPFDGAGGWLKISPDHFADVTAEEITAGTETANRSFSPANIVSLIGAHAPQPSDGGLASVATDGTLNGLGTQASPLSVANPFTNTLLDPYLLRPRDWTAGAQTYRRGTIVRDPDFQSAGGGHFYIALGDVTQQLGGTNPRFSAEWAQVDNGFNIWTNTARYTAGQIVRRHVDGVAEYFIATVIGTVAGEDPATSDQFKRISNPISVTSAERDAGTETQPRSLSPFDVKDMIDTHSAAASISNLSVVEQVTNIGSGNVNLTGNLVDTGIAIPAGTSGDVELQGDFALSAGIDNRPLVMYFRVRAGVFLALTERTAGATPNTGSAPDNSTLTWTMSQSVNPQNFYLARGPNNTMLMAISGDIISTIPLVVRNITHTIATA